MSKFKPGKSGNPGGRPKLPADVQEARKLNKVEFERIANRYLWTNQEAFEKAMTDPDCPMFDKMVGSLLAKGIEKGDPVRLGLVLDRLIGKVTEKVEVSQPKPFVIHRQNGEQTVLGAKVEEEKL